MIEVSNIEFKRQDNKILKNISLSLAKHQTVALIGPNGAGKSTLLSLMARQLPLQKGVITFDSVFVEKNNSSRLAKKISFMPQHSNFMNRLRVIDLLVFARYPYHKGRPQELDYSVVKKTLSYFGLEKWQNHFIDQLSGGLRQLALVAMTFSQDTDYILLDEPLNNLDMFHAKKLMKILQTAINDWKKTIVIVLHDINYASHYADYIVALKHGQVAFQGGTREVLNASNIESLYSVSTEVIHHQGKPVSLHF